MYTFTSAIINNINNRGFTHNTVGQKSVDPFYIVSHPVGVGLKQPEYSMHRTRRAVVQLRNKKNIFNFKVIQLFLYVQ